tara:strand:- start:649 stop:1479 length:831 start_codon:yes stop_codon:yes gene_type:complete
METKKTLWLILVLVLLQGSCTGEIALHTYSRSFVKISRMVKFSICKKKKKKKKIIEECGDTPMATWGAQGSGSVIAANSLGIFVLSAQHVCEDPQNDADFMSTLTSRLLDDPSTERFKITVVHRVTTHEGEVARMEIIAEDREIDTCIAFAPNLKVKPLRRFYGALKKGETYYNIAAPHNIFQPGTVPLFSGHFSGNIDKHRSLFTIPAEAGSSGSPVLDSNGRLVGMIHSVADGFHHVSFSPRTALLNAFIDDNIKDYYDEWYKNMLELTRPKSN